MNEKEKKLISILTQVLNIKRSHVSTDSSVKNIKSWDSLNQMKILLALQKEFKKKIDFSKASELNSFKKLRKFFIKN
jgi:acyl carrier protein